GPGARQRQPVSGTALSEAKLVSGTLPVVPTRESLQPGNRALRRATQPVAPINTRHLFARTASPAGRRPFSQDAAEIKAMMAQPHPPAWNRAVAPSKAASSPAGGAWRVSGGNSQSAGDRQATITATPS